MEEFKNEIWKVIPDFERYEVSNYGRVFSHISRKFLIPRFSKGRGYSVNLWSGSDRSHTSIHRLVAFLFIPNTPKTATIKHIDGNKKNNHVSNLDVLSAKQAERRLVLENALSSGRKVRVLEWDTVYPSVPYLAKHIGTEVTGIYRCLRGERKSHLGLTYEYVN